MSQSSSDYCVIVNSSSESQKGINNVKQCSVENQKGTIATDFVSQQ